MYSERSTFVAVTGGQGVGKSTFSRALHSEISRRTSLPVTLLDGLGEHVRGMGLALGSATEPEGIAAVFAAHLSRESSAPPGLVILDRCMIDALAYVRSLGVSGIGHNALYFQLARVAVTRLALAVHLSADGRFTTTNATHETPELRESVVATIPKIIDELGCSHISINAAESGALEKVFRMIQELHDNR